MRKKIYMKMLMLSGAVLGAYAFLVAVSAYVLYLLETPIWGYGLMLAAWFAVCFFGAMTASSKMTKKIVQPIQKIDLSHPEKGCVYEEMQPIMTRIVRQKKLRQKNEKLRKEFSSNVSHELKTPLTSISGYAELLKNGLVPTEDIPEFSEKIYNESNHMIRLINDIIKLSKLDERHIDIEKESVDLYELAESVAGRLEIQAKKNRIKVAVEGEHIRVQAISQMMDELIYNLCENAIKYNKVGGKVTVVISQKKGRGCICVSDTGIGIPEKYYERVFERFFRADKSHSRQIGGTGLGLAIVKHIVEYHDGDISVTSKVGEGTVFTVTI